MPLHQRRSVQGSAQQAHTTDAASAAAVSFLIGGSALNEACDILLAQQSSQPSASCPKQTESQNQTNEDHCQKLAALYQKSKAAYNIICRADDASTALSSEIMSIMTPGNLAATSSSAVNSTQSSSSSTTANNTPLPRSRGSFSTPHGNKSKMTPGLIHRKRSSMESGGRIISRSLSDTSDVSNNSGGNNNSHRGGGKSAINISAAKKQQAQQKTRKADPPPEVLNFLKALNSGGSAAAPSSTPPSSSSSTTTASAASTNNDSNNASNSRKRPPVSSYAPKKSTRKRQPPPPRRQPSRSSTDEEHDDDEANEGTAPTTTPTTMRRTRSTRRGVSSITDTNTRVYGIGESVFVQVDGKHYNAIVKNVDFKADEDEEGDDVMKQHRAVYEVEFSDGEVWEDVGDDDVHSADEEE